MNGIAKIETQAPPKGRETGLLLPTAIKGIFTPEFVSRFVFDGEQAKKSMDRTSNEADETIRYLYRLDELDEILAMNMNILTEIQNAEGGSTGTRGSLSNLRSRQKKVRDHIASLEKKQKQLNGDIARFSQEKIEKEKQRQELDKNYEALNKEKNEVIAEQEKNRGNVDVKITEIVSLVKTPYLVSEGLCNRMYEFGDAMKKLKLPKSSSKDFFTELAYAEKCVCDRCIGEKERDAILKNAERYLGSDHQAVLNNIKSVLMGSTYDEHLVAAFEELGKLQEQKTRLNARFADVEDKLIKAGGPQVEQLQSEIEVLIGQISSAQTQLKIIESKDEDDETLTEENNLHKARRADAEYEVKIASTTKTNAALRKKNVVQDLVNEIKTQATAALKEEIIKKANDKISRVIKDDYIEIESIDGYIMLEKFMFRHKSVCNLGHQKLSELYMQEAVKIRRDPENYRLTGLRTTLKEYIETECTDAVFKVGLSNLKYRTNGGNKPLRYLFSTLNEHIEWYRNGAVGAPAPQKGTVINYDNVTIEHIASQSPSAAVPGFTSENIHMPSIFSVRLSSSRSFPFA